MKFIKNTMFFILIALGSWYLSNKMVVYLTDDPSYQNLVLPSAFSVIYIIAHLLKSGGFAIWDLFTLALPTIIVSPILGLGVGLILSIWWTEYSFMQNLAYGGCLATVFIHVLMMITGKVDERHSRKYPHDRTPVSDMVHLENKISQLEQEIHIRDYHNR